LGEEYREDLSNDGVIMRKILKRLIFLLFLMPNAIIFLLYRLLGVIFGTKQVFVGFSQGYSLLPGIVGDYCRSSFYFLSLKSCSPDVTINFGTFFPTRDIEIGKYVYIGANCIISSSVIENDVVIGSNIHIIDGKLTHNFDDTETPIRLQGGVATPIHIGADCWIGNCAIIMANIGTKCIVGAGTVVTKPVDAYSVVVGNPSRVLKKRFNVPEYD
jgi:virginiamycin A acetyltransferase